MSVDFEQATRHYILEDTTLHDNRYEKSSAAIW
jgi:hypothetical protein